MFLAVCAMAHVALAQASPSPWWIPDLTVIGVLFSVIRTPHRWLVLSGVGGLVMMVWVIRVPVPMFICMLLFGWTIRMVGGHWDLADARIQCWLAATATTVLTFGGLWLDEQWSAALIGLALLHVALTTLCVPCFRWFAKPMLLRH